MFSTTRFASHVMAAEVKVSPGVVGCTIGSFGSQVLAGGAFVVIYAEGLVSHRQAETIAL